MAISAREFDYEVDGASFSGTIVLDAAHAARRPVVMVCHGWEGHSDAQVEGARSLATLGYVGFACVFRTRYALSSSAISAGMRALARCALGPSERGARCLRPEASDRDPGDHQLVGRPQRGRKARGVERGERALGLVDAPDQKEAPDLDTPRVRGVCPVAVRFERLSVPRRAPSPASRGRARRARYWPRRRRTSRGRRPLSDRRHAWHVAGAPSLERDRRAAQSRCLEAREQARRRAGRPDSMRRGDRPPRARAPPP